VAAAYLAKAGKKVLVLERKSYRARRDDPAAQYTRLLHDEHSSVHIMIQGNPMLRNDELGLIAKHGLKYHTRMCRMRRSFRSIGFVHLQGPRQDLRVFREDLAEGCGNLPRLRQAESARCWNSSCPAYYAPPPPLGELVAMLAAVIKGG